jgi:hypothetical protein
MLNELFVEHHPMRDRLMYGSDWSMLLQHPRSEEYLGAVSSTFPEGQRQRLQGGRALNFLGLGASPNKNGTRIMSRIEALGASPGTWISEGTTASDR